MEDQQIEIKEFVFEGVAFLAMWACNMVQFWPKRLSPTLRVDQSLLGRSPWLDSVWLPAWLSDFSPKQLKSISTLAAIASLGPDEEE